MCAFEITCALRQGGCVMWSAARLFTHGFPSPPVSVQGGGLSATCYDANEVNTSSSARLHLVELWFPCLHVSQFVRLSKIAAVCLLNGNVFWRPGNKIPSRYSSHFLLWTVAIGVAAASHTSQLHVLLHNIHTSPLCSCCSPPACQVLLQPSFSTAFLDLKCILQLCSCFSTP